MSHNACVLFWFRRDLRLADNIGLLAALDSGKPVCTAFVFDDRLLHGSGTGATRVAFLLENLHALDTALHALGGRLIMRRGDPAQQIAVLARDLGATAVFANNDVTPYAKMRDARVAHALGETPFHTFDDAMVLPPGRVMTGDGRPYTVFTPFKNAWRKLSTRHPGPAQDATPDRFAQASSVVSDDLPTLADLGVIGQPAPRPPVGEAGAQQTLDMFVSESITDYAHQRNSLTRTPFDGTPGHTAQTSPHLRLGTLSPRQALHAARAAYTAYTSVEARRSIEAWVDELIWREFYMHVMSHFPHVVRGNFNRSYDLLRLQDDPRALQAWQNGQTGYPVVDAAMRQLKACGWLPNRARMIVASFLTKHLLIDWRAGERHFMQHLVDGDPSANNGGWQWAAGTGTDAQPYFRIFNPVTQGETYDPDGDYVRHWVPELADVPSAHIHHPWTLPTLPSGYPAPIVEHKAARERALAAFKAARER